MFYTHGIKKQSGIGLVVGTTGGKKTNPKYKYFKKPKNKKPLEGYQNQFQPSF
jgi:type II secretory ATPase GspE/PulE/Tfp pilus assembly ATPase PilB-like protein